jgi:hypothetical protein
MTTQEGRKKSVGYLDQKHATRIYDEGAWQIERPRAALNKSISLESYVPSRLLANMHPRYQGRLLQKLEGIIHKTRPDVKGP